jgi:hypothetical protein
MWEALSRDSSTLPMMLFWGMIFVTIISTYGIKTWRKHEAAKMDHELKLEMVAHGMSADEIERVLTARSAQKLDLDETQPYPKR